MPTSAQPNRVASSHTLHVADRVDQPVSPVAFDLGDLGLQLRLQPFALRRRQPGRLGGTVGEIVQGEDAQQNRRYAFGDEHPLPAVQAGKSV